MEKTAKRNLPFQDYIKIKKEKRKTTTKRPSSHRSGCSFVTRYSSKCKANCKTLVRGTKFICSDQRSLNKEISYIRKTMEWNGYPLNVFIKKERTL